MRLESRLDKNFRRSVKHQPYETILIVGDIAAGKETFTKRFENEFYHNGKTAKAFSSGEELRQVDRTTPLGRIIGPIIDAAQLVPDELLMDFVREKLAKREQQRLFDREFNYLLADGVVRTQPQIELFEKFARVYAVLDLSIPIDVANSRAEIRYNLALEAHLRDPIKNSKPRPEDAKEELRRKRYLDFAKEAEPVREYYGEKGLLIRIDATPPKDQVYDSAVRALMPFLLK